MNQPSFEIQVLSSIGAVLILIAYIGHQMKWMDSDKLSYNLLNTLGVMFVSRANVKRVAQDDGS